MAYYPPGRNNFSTPSLTRLSGENLAGLAPKAKDSLNEAIYLQNLWKDAAGNMVRRPGAVCVEQIEGSLQIEARARLGGQTYYVCRDSDAFYVGVRCADGGWYQRKEGRKKPCLIPRKDMLVIICEKEWIVIAGEKITLYSADGKKEITDLTLFPLADGYAPFALSDDFFTVPTVRVASRPMGVGGNALQQVNLLSPLVRESFCYTTEDQQNNRNRFCLALALQVMGALPVSAEGTTDGISTQAQNTRLQTLTNSIAVEVRVKKTDAQGNDYFAWEKYPLSYKDHINAAASAVWLSSVQSLPLMQDGEDNLRFIYRRESSAFAEGFERLCGCTLWTMHGVDGYKDRLFLSGNQTAADHVWFSGMDDIFYFGAYDFLQVGTGDARVMALAGQDTRLCVLCNNGAYLVTGRAETGGEGYVQDACFTVSSALSLPSPVKDSNVVVAGGEMVFLTRDGVAAITTSGVLDERCVARRSGRLEPMLLQNLINGGVLCTLGDYLFISDRNGHIYLLDLAHKVSAEHPHSAFGYAAYYWTDLAAHTLWAEENTLYFCNDNAVFKLDVTQSVDERCAGQITRHPICVVWQTPTISGNGFDACTEYKSFSVRLVGQNAAACVWLQEDGGPWQKVKDYEDFYDGLQYGRLQYRRWRYGAAKNAFVMRLVLRISHCRGIAFRLENDRPDFSFGLCGLAVEYL